MIQRLITIAIFLAIIMSSFYFGFNRLKNFSGVDEPYWSYGRVPNFWNAIQAKKWKSTNISDKPGVPLAIISGAGLPFIHANPKDYKKFRYEAKTPEQLQKISDIYFDLRLPVFLFTMAMLPIFYYLIKQLLGGNVAKFSLIFLGFSPILLGISLIINSDALLWIFSALSILSLFVFLEKNGFHSASLLSWKSSWKDERKFLLLSGFFLGLSVITKYVANILFVYFFLLFLLEYIFYAREKISIGKYLSNALANYIALVLAAMVTAYAFFPATWVKFSVLINATIGNRVFASTWPMFLGLIFLLAVDVYALKSRISNTVFGFFSKYRSILARAVAGLFLFFSFLVFLHVFAHVRIFDLQGIIASPKGIGQGNQLLKYSGAISADIFSLLFSISPLALFLVMAKAAMLCCKKEFNRPALIAIYILIFIFIFYLGSAVNQVITTVRYQIIVYPLIFVLAALGIDEISRVKKIKKLVPTAAMYVFAICVLIISLFYTRPNFLAYASEILPHDYIVNLKGMGEGSFEAANWLNQIPNAKNLTIWSDKGAVCERFLGNCFIDFKKQTFAENKIDYFVVSTDRRSRSLKMSKSLVNTVDFKQIYEGQNAVFRVTISHNPNDFVKIFKAADYIKPNNAPATN